MNVKLNWCKYLGDLNLSPAVWFGSNVFKVKEKIKTQLYVLLKTFDFSFYPWHQFLYVFVSCLKLLLYIIVFLYFIIEIFVNICASVQIRPVATICSRPNSSTVSLLLILFSFKIHFVLFLHFNSPLVCSIGLLRAE